MLFSTISTNTRHEARKRKEGLMDTRMQVELAELVVLDRS